ncbi:MAG: amino acid adenylation domain-containing protein [Xenococcaceae cyanobacterium]
MNYRDSNLEMNETQKVPTVTEIQAWLVDYLAAELEIKPEQIELKVPLESYGLDSSAAIVLIGDLQDWLGYELEPELLFDYQTIAELTQYIVDSGLLDSVSPISKETEKVKVTPIFHQPDTTDVYPLSHGQQALWFLYKLAPESSAYNIAFTARISENVDILALHGAFQKLVDRHPLLRTTFGERDSQPVQQVLPQQEVCCEEIDAGNWDEEQLKQEVIASYKRPFDLDLGPVLRVSLFKSSQKNDVLLITLHHIISDGWSVWMLLDELRVLYPAEREGNIANLPPLDFSYRDYLNWQSQMLQGNEGEKLRSYWRSELAGELPILNLPTDRPRPAVQTYNGASHKFSLSSELTQQLRELAHAEKVSLFMLLLAAYQVLLYRYTNQEDILVGVPMKCRNQSEFTKIFGYLVNPVVLRGKLSGNTRFQDFLHQVRHKVLGAVAHQDYPFPLLVDELSPERDSSHSPLVQTMFVFQKPQQSGDILDLFALERKEDKVNWGGLQLEPFDLPQQEGQFELSVEMMEAGNTVLGVFHYNTDLFDASTIQRMEGHFQTLLNGIVAHPEELVGKLPLLTEAELHQLLGSWNDTLAEYPEDKCIHELFEEQVAKTPDSPAVVFEGEQLTYQELNSRANQLAHYLQSLGVAPEVLVGICLERSVEMIVALLGILKAGGAYVPIDPVYPQERLAFMLCDAGVEVLLTQEKLVSKLPKSNAQLVCFDTDGEAISRQSEKNLISQIKSENLAYIIYTSGSTGKPKGVAVSHRAIARLLFNTNYIQIDSSDKFAQVANTSFDAATFEIWGALLHGAKLVIIKRDVVFSPQNFAKCIREQEISILFLTTALFEQLASQLPQAFSSLKYLLFGGEVVNPQRVREVLNNNSPQQLLHVYGPTENTTFSSWYLVEEVPLGMTNLPIGKPIANTQIHILDRYLQLVPIGVPGELHIGGVGLAQGYFNRPELTAEKFISNPFSQKEGVRLYKTGDLARYLPDGNLEFLSRIDHQVKIRGFRIELGEIESVLAQHSQVREAVVITREHPSSSKSLVAYIVSEQDSLMASELRNYLKDRLPDYMIPSAFVQLEALPLTPNGKVDRLALPAPERTDRITKSILVAPRNSTEEILAIIWAEVLGIKQVGVYDNFFEMGGHSLLATQVVSRVREAFSVELPLSSLFETSNLADLAELIVSQQLQNAERDSLEQILAEFEELSSEEAKQLLSE